MTSTGPGDVDAAPSWFETTVLGAAATAAAVGLIGLVLALMGVYSTWLAVLLGVPVGVAVTLPIGRRHREAATRRASASPAVAALLVALAFVAVASRAPSQHVVIDRDPGSYLTTARWLVHDGGLHAVVDEGGLHNDDLLRHGGSAVFRSDDRRVEFQFTHLSAVLLAVGYDVGSSTLMLRTPALITGLGLLALYAVAVRATRRPWAALVAPLAAACALPILFVARDTYSEPFAFALLWAALLAAAVAADGGQPAGWVVPGLVLGAAVGARPDSVLVMVAGGIALVAHVSAGQGEDRRRRALGALTFAGTLALAGAVMAVDLWGASSGYARRHGPQVVMAGGLAAGATVAAAACAWLMARGWRPVVAVARARSSLAAWCGAAVVALMLAAWLVRPHVQVTRGATEVSLIRALQSMEGVAIDPARRYGELSLVWQSWYLGPVGLAVAIVGIGLAVRALVRGDAPRVMALATLGFLVVGAVALWRPRITPDQVWAMRRFVPVVLPGLCLAAALAVSEVLGSGRGSSSSRRALAGTLALLLVGWSAWVTWPLRSIREQYGRLTVVEEACRLIGPDASVVVVGGAEASTLPHTLRAFCGVPVRGLQADSSVEDLDPVRSAVEAEGRELVLVSADPTLLGGYGPVQVTGRAVEERRAERTLLRAPRRYADPDPGWQLGVVRVEE